VSGVLLDEHNEAHGASVVATRSGSVKPSLVPNATQIGEEDVDAGYRKDSQSNDQGINHLAHTVISCSVVSDVSVSVG
jgi:hypothetical protein